MLEILCLSVLLGQPDIPIQEGGMIGGSQDFVVLRSGRLPCWLQGSKRRRFTGLLLTSPALTGVGGLKWYHRQVRLAHLNLQGCKSL